MTNMSLLGACFFFSPFLFFFRHFLLPQPHLPHGYKPNTFVPAFSPAGRNQDGGKKRQNFSIFLNPFVRGLQVISPLTPDIILAPLAGVGGCGVRG